MIALTHEQTEHIGGGITAEQAGEAVGKGIGYGLAFCGDVFLVAAIVLGAPVGV